MVSDVEVDSQGLESEPTAQISFEPRGVLTKPDVAEWESPLKPTSEAEVLEHRRSRFKLSS